MAIQIAMLGDRDSGSTNRVFMTIKNNQGDVLEPGKVVEFSSTTTDADQGFAVELVDTAVNVTSGIGAQVAGVVDSTLNTAEKGKIQIFGPANVRAQASLAADVQVVASSINATNIGHVATASQSTLTSPSYIGALVGWTLENGPNATNATVFLKCF